MCSIRYSTVDEYIRIAKQVVADYEKELSMSSYSRNDLYINSLENEVISLNTTVDQLVVENFSLKEEIEKLKINRVDIPDFEYHNREYKEIINE